MSLEALFPYAESLRQSLGLESDRFAGLVLAEELDLNCHAFRTLNKVYPAERAMEIYSAVVAGFVNSMPGSTAEAMLGPIPAARRRAVVEFPGETWRLGR